MPPEDKHASNTQARRNTSAADHDSVRPSMGVEALIQHRVTSIQFTGNNQCRITFAPDGSTASPPTLEMSVPESAALLLFAAFAHDELRGSNITHHFVERHINLKYISAIYITKLSSEQIILRIIKPDRSASEHNFERIPSNIVSAPTHEEYFTLPLDKFQETGVFPPGRALYPVPFGEWCNRARDIVENSNSLRDLLSLPPMMVTLGITSACHLSCEFCYVTPRFSEKFGKSYTSRAPFVMPKNTLFSLIEHLSGMGVKAIRYVGEGESTLHPHFIESLVFARARGMRTSLITSGGSIINQSSILAASLDYFRISLNAGTPFTYQTVHHAPFGQFARVLEGVRKVVRARQTSPPGPLISCSFVATSNNYLELPTLCIVADSMGVDFVIVKKDTAWKLTPREAETHALLVARCKTIFHHKERFLVFDYPKMQKQKMAQFPNFETKLGVGCFVCNAGMRSNVSYNVAYSCMRFEGPGTILADLDEVDFPVAWHGAARTEAAETKIALDKSQPCTGCFWKDEKFWMSYFIDLLIRGKLDP